MKCSPLTVQHFDHITFNSQWICISQLLRLDFPMWWHSHTCIPHTNSLCLQPFSPALSLSALQSVMDQRTCPKVLYRQHTCSMSLHADATLQLQPCTVDVCVCVDIQRWLHRLCEGPPVLCVCVRVFVYLLWHCSNGATSHVTLNTGGNEMYDPMLLDLDADWWVERVKWYINLFI